ncbi:MAG: hypothetical protein COC23_05365 [Hyphomicrobiales bacterium]|nr:MAG: hypothetical protein COC23_05365 [Hyphomicrobiales bacterium]
MIIQTILLLAIAFILGCILGCLMRRLLGTAEVETPVAAIGATAAVGLAAKRAAAPNVPIVPKPPVPVAPKPRRAAPKKRAKPVSNKDNLKLIKGVGPQNEGRLNELGVHTFAQIAQWKKKDEVHYGDVLAFPGRIEREEWVKQAKVLARGGATEFARRVKSGAVESSIGKANAGDMGKKPAVLKSAKGGKPDNLTLIDGVGNAIEKKMFKLGIFHFSQVAKMSKAELTWLGNAVGFPGRPERENWVGESKILGAGGTTEHAKRVERGQIKTSRKS